MKAALLFALATILLIAVTAWVIALAYTSSAAHQAILVSALVAFVVQLVAFAIVRVSRGPNVIAGWAAGVLLRFVVLGVYALVVVKAFALPSAPALVSLATFFFLSTLIEPLLLRS